MLVMVDLKEKNEKGGRLEIKKEGGRLKSLDI